MTTFTDLLWQENLPIYEGIMAHPFNQELMAGTLAKDKFQFYIGQDALYLADFGRALSVVGAKAPEVSLFMDFVKFSEGTVVVERALHEQYFRLFDVEAPAAKAPGCFAYTHFLLSTAALGTYAEGVAALLPCFWIYREVGNHIYAHSAPGNPYQAWIDTYAGEEYGALVDRAIAITNQAAERASEQERAAMRHAYRQGSRMEWMFWDSAYRLEKWQPC